MEFSAISGMDREKHKRLLFPTILGENQGLRYLQDAVT